jgi:hypothetical protein
MTIDPFRVSDAPFIVPATPSIEKSSEVDLSSFSSDELERLLAAQKNLFAHVHLDAIAKNTGYEGLPVGVAPQYLLSCLQALLQGNHLKSLLEEIAKICIQGLEGLTEYTKKLEECIRNELTIEDFSSQIVEQLDALRENQTYLMPGGYSGKPGHAMYVEFKKIGKNQFDVFVFNAQQRSSFYQGGKAVHVENEVIREKVAPFYYFKNISRDLFVEKGTNNSSFLRAMIELHIVPIKNKYQSIEEEDMQKVLALFMPYQATLNKRYPLFISVQRSGTCGWHSLMAWALFKADQVAGEEKNGTPLFKDLSLYIKFYTLLAQYKTRNFEESICYQIEQASIFLARDLIPYLEEKKSTTLSHDILEKMLYEIKEIEKEVSLKRKEHLMPQEEVRRIQGHAIPEMQSAISTVRAPSILESMQMPVVSLVEIKGIIPADQLLKKVEACKELLDNTDLLPTYCILGQIDSLVSGISIDMAVLDTIDSAELGPLCHMLKGLYEKYCKLLMKENLPPSVEAILTTTKLRILSFELSKRSSAPLFQKYALSLDIFDDFLSNFWDGVILNEKAWQAACEIKNYAQANASNKAIFCASKSDTWFVQETLIEKEELEFLKQLIEKHKLLETLQIPDIVSQQKDVGKKALIDQLAVALYFLMIKKEDTPEEVQRVIKLRELALFQNYMCAQVKYLEIFAEPLMQLTNSTYMPITYATSHKNQGKLRSRALDYSAYYIRVLHQGHPYENAALVNGQLSSEERSLANIASFGKQTKISRYAYDLIDQIEKFADPQFQEGVKAVFFEPYQDKENKETIEIVLLESIQQVEVQKQLEALIKRGLHHYSQSGLLQLEPSLFFIRLLHLLRPLLPQNQLNRFSVSVQGGGGW